jgi:iron-sulfur cluster repair protein YtfE (RIC family)
MPDHAIAFLEADHRHVEELFRQYRTPDRHGEPQRVVGQLCREAEVHIQLEEEVFYPAIRARAGQDGKDLVATSYQEHNVMRDLIKRLGEIGPGDTAYGRTVHELQALFSHHVQREETRLFPLAARLLRDELENLGQTLRVRKSQLVASPQAGI